MCLPMVVKHPERLIEKGEHAGHQWNITNNGIGYRCGYVRVDKGHPWFGSRGDIDAEVHGGITFSDFDVSCGKGPDDGYWVGFDCAHSGDLPDPSLVNLDGSESNRQLVESINRLFEGMANFEDHSIKNTDYVRAQCLALCEQASKAAA
jgi:hypothetical protein